MRALGLLALLLVLVTGAAIAGPPAERFFPYAFENYALENGFKSVLIPMKGSGLVAYYTVVRTGSRDEWEPGRSGFAHFFEHMMFRGTEKYPADEYNRLVSEMGANANAYTSDDITCYYMVIPSAELETAMDLESDRFQNLSYEEGPFRTEAGAVYGEYRKNFTSPFRIAYEKMLDTAFDQHTYKHTTMGFEKDIIDMPNMYEYSISFFNRYYRPENCVLMIVGDFESNKVKPMIEKYYGGWEPGYVEPKIDPEPPQKGERSVDVTYKGRTLPLVWMAFKGDAFDPSSKAVASAYLLADLAFGENSEIYKKLVIREQKVQWIAGDFGFNRDPKLYDVYTRVKDEADIDYVIGEIDAAAEKFKTDLVSEDELNNIKMRTRYGYLMRLDTPGNVASALARTIALTGGIDAVDQLYSTIATITPEDIKAAAQRYLEKDRRTVLVLKGDKS
ncbi:MAG: insulinase family protein [Candidatus Latescibacterota bacterium]|nr:MAG: insulinase family protein [Candidatus Latescibacterota bacterium]